MGCTPFLLLSLALCPSETPFSLLFLVFSSTLFYTYVPLCKGKYCQVKWLQDKCEWGSGLRKTLTVTLTTSLGPLARAQLPGCLEGHLEADHFCDGPAWSPKTGVVIPKS